LKNSTAHSAIADWVGSGFSDIDDLLSPIVKTANNGPEYMNRTTLLLDQGLYRMIEKNIEAHLNILACVVHRFVGHRVLNKYAFGIGDDTSNFLLTVERHMTEQDSLKGRLLVCNLLES
jgi:hypothetical protein